MRIKTYYISCRFCLDEEFMCGGILTESDGLIASVDRNNDTLYETNLQCVWIIVAPITHVIELNFTFIDIEYHKNCEWDHIRVGSVVHYI